MFAYSGHAYGVLCNAIRPGEIVDPANLQGRGNQVAEKANLAYDTPPFLRFGPKAAVTRCASRMPVKNSIEAVER